jgi:hypothetical protein
LDGILLLVRSAVDEDGIPDEMFPVMPPTVDRLPGVFDMLRVDAVDDDRWCCRCEGAG